MRRRDDAHAGQAQAGEDPASLFREETADVTPLPHHGRANLEAAPVPPFPLHFAADEEAAILASLHDPVRWHEDTEIDGDTSFIRPGLSRQILRRLRRGEWHTQSELDLHGLTRLDAKHELAHFLHDCLRRRVRCVRIIHGKGLGSKNREPVLKTHVRHWLTQRDEVLAWVEARPVDGGSGALVVLLKAR